MFSRGSRYRRLPDSVSINAKGELLIGKVMRATPRTEARLVHTVNDGDRLNLLAFKYYGDPTKWWQISDANPARAEVSERFRPQYEFPTDVVDAGPIAEESWVIDHAGSAARYDALLLALGSFVAVTAWSAVRNYVIGDLSSRLGVNYYCIAAHVNQQPPNPTYWQPLTVRPDLTQRSFVESSISGIYSAATLTRPQIVQAIANNNFHLIHTVAWKQGTQDAERFVFDDPQVKLNWRLLLGNLRALPGMVQAQSIMAEATLHLIYNQAMTPRADIVTLLTNRGFSIAPESSRIFSRVGTGIFVPPNQIT